MTPVIINVGYLPCAFILIVFTFRMPRQWKRKTERGVPAPVLIAASKEVAKGNSIRSVAKGFEICHVTCTDTTINLKNSSSKDRMNSLVLNTGTPTPFLQLNKRKRKILARSV